MEAIAVTINDSPKPDKFICFVCHAHYDIARLGIDEAPDTGIPNFCPNCGLKVVDIKETLEYKHEAKLVKEVYDAD